MATSSFRTDKEQRIWDDLIADIEGVDELKTVASVTRVLGGITAAASAMPLSPDVKRKLLAMVGQLRAAVTAQDKDHSQAIASVKTITSELHTAISNWQRDHASSQQQNENESRAKQEAERKEHQALLRAELSETRKAMPSDFSQATVEHEKRLNAQLAEILVGESTKARQEMRELLERLGVVGNDAGSTRKSFEGLQDEVADLKSKLTGRDAAALPMWKQLKNEFVSGFKEAATEAYTKFQEARVASRSSVVEEHADNDAKYEAHQNDYDEARSEKTQSDFVALFRKQVDAVRELGSKYKIEDKGLGSTLGLIGAIAGIGALSIIDKAKQWLTPYAEDWSSKLKRLWEDTKIGVDGVKDSALSTWNLVTEKATELTAYVSEVWGTITEKFGVFRDYVSEVWGGVTDKVKSLIGYAGDAWDWASAKIGSFVDAAVETWYSVTDKVKSATTTALNVVRSYTDPIISSVMGIIDAVDNFLKGPYDKLQGFVQGYAERWKDTPVIGSVLGKVSSTMKDASSVKGLVSSVGEASSSTTGAWAESFLRMENDNASLMGKTATTAHKLMQSGSDMMGSAATSAHNLVQSGSDFTGSAAALLLDNPFGRVKDFASRAYDSLATAAGSLFKTTGNVDLDGLHPAMSQRVLGAIQDYNLLSGDKDVVITSAFRSFAEQSRLHEQNPKKAAPPGKSLHQFGLAIDADSRALTEMDNMGILRKWGLSRPIPGEPWHVQPMGVGKSAAAQGILSADSPVHQQGKQPSVSTVPATLPPAPSVVPKASREPVSEVSNRSGGRQSNSQQSRGGTQVDDVNMFSYSDSGFFASNIGVLAP